MNVLKSNKDELSPSLSKKLDGAFVVKHLNRVLRQKDLMVSHKSQANGKIKEILGRYYLLLASNIEHVMKNIARKKIVTQIHIEEAYTRL